MTLHLQYSLSAFPAEKSNSLVCHLVSLPREALGTKLRHHPEYVLHRALLVIMVFTFRSSDWLHLPATFSKHLILVVFGFNHKFDCGEGLSLEMLVSCPVVFRQYYF